MTAVARLVLTYFTATPLMRALLVLGLVCVAAGMTGYILMPAWTLGAGLRAEALWYQMLVLALPWFGLILLLAASALMPAIVERIALGRLIWILPRGRVRLLASIVVPVALLALLTAVAATLAFLQFTREIDYGHVFYRTLFMGFVDFGLIYTAIWLVGKTSGVWRLAGLLWAIVSISIPLRYLNGIPPFSVLEGLGLAACIVFGALLLSGGRIRHASRPLRAPVIALARRIVPPQRYASGRETDLLLGIGQPWIIALGQVIPIGVMAWFAARNGVWFVLLMIFSAIAGAITSQAAARSRRVWLRLDEQRDQLFRRIEFAYWRYNAYSLGVLLLLFVALAIYFRFPLPAIALGTGLLVVGCSVFIYLGLMNTRGLGWFEATLCILTMIALSLAALSIMRQSSKIAVEILVLLAGLAVAYRLMARSRWRMLDWMQCGTVARTRTGG